MQSIRSVHAMGVVLFMATVGGAQVGCAADRSEVGSSSANLLAPTSDTRTSDWEPAPGVTCPGTLILDDQSLDGDITFRPDGARTIVHLVRHHDRGSTDYWVDQKPGVVRAKQLGNLRYNDFDLHRLDQLQIGGAHRGDRDRRREDRAPLTRSGNRIDRVRSAPCPG